MIQDGSVYTVKKTETVTLGKPDHSYPLHWTVTESLGTCVAERAKS